MKLWHILVGTAAVTLPQTVHAETLKIEVATAEARLDESTGQAVIQIQLSPASTQAFLAFTTAHVGDKVTLRLGTRVIIDPVIREPIAKGTLNVSGELTQDDARQLAADIQDAGNTLEIDGPDSTKGD